MHASVKTSIFARFFQTETTVLCCLVSKLEFAFLYSLDETVMIIALYGYLVVFMLPRGLYPMYAAMNEMII